MVCDSDRESGSGAEMQARHAEEMCAVCKLSLCALNPSRQRLGTKRRRYQKAPGSLAENARRPGLQVLGLHQRKAYLMARSSTSKIRVALGGMTPPAPRDP
jgi:hypothetical protein